MGSTRFVPALVLSALLAHSYAVESANDKFVEEIFGNSSRFRVTCDMKGCVRKCCPLDQFVFNKTCRSSVNVKNLVSNYSEQFGVDGFLDCDGGFRLLLNEPSDSVAIRNGSLVWNNTAAWTFDSRSYCVDWFDDSTDEEPTAMICMYTEYIPPVKFRNYLGMIISLPFLVATFTVYACLSDRNVHGNCLMCYVASLAVAYIFLVTILLYPTHLENVSCNVLAYICYIAFLASFFWMNAMCLDLFWAFSGKRGYGGDNKSQLKRFAFFNVYAWGIPFLLLIIVIILNGTMDQNSPIYPGIALKKCWFSDGLPVFLYFYLIIAIILVINLGCFILTALQIRKVRQDTAMLHRTDSQRHSYDNDRHKFDLYLKLLLAMGINWTMEVISWAVEWQLGSNVPEELFYATDFCNACYGVIIFIIFVCNKEKRRRLRKWYYSITGRPMRAQSMSNSSQTTRITHAAAERTTTNDSALLRDPK